MAPDIAHTSGCSRTWVKVVNAVGRPQQWGRALGEAFAHNGIQPVVNSVLMSPQQLHHWVVGTADNTEHVQVKLNLARKCPPFWDENIKIQSDV